MAASGEDGLPAPAAEAIEGVRSRAERLEHVLERFVPLPDDGGQPALRHRRRMRLLGELEASRGLPDEQRAKLEESSGIDGPLFELNVVRIDGWIRSPDRRWYVPEDPRAVPAFATIAPVDDPRAISMDDDYLIKVMDLLEPWLEGTVPKLKHELAADEPLSTSIALARAGLYYLDRARAAATRERDPEQRARRHARRLELIGHAVAARGLTESDLEKVRQLSPLAEVLFSYHALRTDGWTELPDGTWRPPAEAGEPPPRNTG